LKLSVEPFEESGIGFKDISLNGKDVLYDGKDVDMDELSLSLDTNVTTIKLDGSMHDKDIRIKTLSIVDIDTLAFPAVIEKMIEMNIHKDIVERVEPEVVEYKAGREHLLPKRVQVDSFLMTVKPAVHPQLRVDRGEVKASSIDVDIYGIMDHKRDTIQVGSYSQILDTNLSRVSVQAKLEDETITVESLSLLDIDTIALIKLFGSMENNQTVSDESTESNTAADPLLPKFLYIKQLDSSIKGATYGPVIVKNAEVNASKVKVDMATFTAESGELDLTAVSNFVSLVQHGVIKDNQLKGRGDITAHQALFEIYGLPLKEELFAHIPLKVIADKKQIMVDLNFKGKEILQRKEGEFNIEEFSLKNHMTYVISEAKLTVTNEGNLSIPYAKAMGIDNVLTLEDGVLDYKGKVIPGEFEGLDAYDFNVLNKLKITYEGNAQGIEAKIDSEGLKGTFVSADLKKGDLRLSTKHPVALNKMITLPKELNASKVTVELHVPLDFSALMPLHVNVKTRSDLANSDVEIVYGKTAKVSAKTIFPENSLLRTFSPKLNLDALSPLESNLTMSDNDLHLGVRSEGISAYVKLDMENKDLEGNMLLGGAEFLFKGNVEKKLSLENSVSSLEGLLQKISTIYAFDVPPLDGDAKISLVLTEMKEVALTFSSNTLIYKADIKTEHVLNDTMISLGYSDSNLTLNSYHTTFDTQKIFATKPSLITLKEGKVEISPLWVNDELKVTGQYDIETQNGEILAFADVLNVSDERVDLKSRVDIKTSLKEGETAVEGTITILGGEIHYDMDIKTFSADSDIVNVEELKKKKSTPFKDNLLVSIKVNTEKALNYKTAEADIKANVDLMIQKAVKGPVSVLGTVEILEGSSYRFENKKFTFKKSAINFTGDINKPLLDIVAVYKTVNAEITIQILGSLGAPDMIFSSIPHMSRGKILSTILFGSQDNDQELSEDDMLGMMGGQMAQSVFSNAGTGAIKSVFSKVGINIDSIPFIGGSPDANSTKKRFLSFLSFDDEVVIPSHEIHFKGQKYINEKALQKAMGVDTKSIFSFWKADKPTIKDKLLPTLEQSLQNFYDSQGFYNAEFSIKTSKTDVIVKIDENDPVKIKDINVSSDYDISKLVIIKKDQIFKAKEFVSIKNHIIEKLLEEGYCSYDLDSKAYVDLDTHEVDVRFKLSKGGVCTFGQLSIKGLETIDDSVVISRVRAREGERFSTKQIRETHDAIYALEAFDSVYVKHDRKIYNVVPIDVETVEVAKPWYVKGDVDYDTSVGVRVSAEVLRTNFMGNAKEISLGITYSKIDKLAELGYFVPALFKVSDYYIDFTSKIGYSTFKFIGFKEEKTFAKAFLSYNDEKLSINIGVAIENIDISLRNFTSPLRVEPGNFSVLYPYLHLIYDSRDSRIDPKNGYYIGGTLEYGLPYKKKASSYVTYTLEGRVIHTFSDLTLSAVAKAGIFEQKENDIPESKLFFAGGVYSNRAYGYKRVGVIYSPTFYGIRGGSTMANLSLEANYPIMDNLYGAVFTDNTMLTRDEYDFSGDILSSGGLGVRYITPIGPIKVDIGMNLHDSSDYAMHFQIGQSF
jgi:outer membrane translocation and assembly module TamA